MFAHYSINPAYIVSGVLVGVLVGLTGVGGGSLMTPLLVLVFGINPATAVGTDLLYAAMTKTGGTLVHGFNKNVDWQIIRRLATGSIPATILTLLALSQLNLSAHATSSVISVVLGIALILTAIALIFRSWILNRYAAYVADLPEQRIRSLTIVLGAVLGVFVSLSSVGAGAIGMAVLLVLYPHLPTARLVGSDIAHAVPLTLVAGIGHWYLGSIDWSLLASLLIGALPGIAVGSQLAAHVPDRVLRPLLATTLAGVGARLIV